MPKSPDPREWTIAEEFEEFDREVMIHEIRLRRGRPAGEDLAAFFRMERMASPRLSALARLAHRHTIDRERDAELDRLDWLCNGA